jgi:dehydrogenase/reductase SDR family protein 1
MSQPLQGYVAVVTRASRGIGKGVALALGEAGATVYVTGRTLTPGTAPLPGTIGETASEVTARGGRGIAVQCDHGDDQQVEQLFQRIKDEQGTLDILVNNVFFLPDGPLFQTPFWEQPVHFWDDFLGVGCRAHYIASRLAVPLMLPKQNGLIANISSFGGGSYQINVSYGVGKAAVDRMARDMAKDLKPHGIASVSLWPGVVRTERIMGMGDAVPFDMSVTESPELTGRAIIALATAPNRMAQTGKRHIVAELAQEYGFTDTDGSQPRSLRHGATS